MALYFQSCSDKALRLLDDRCYLLLEGEASRFLLQIQGIGQTNGSLASILLASVPGVLVGLVTVYATHKASQNRERKKEVTELCGELVDAAEEAFSSSYKAWNCEVGSERAKAILDTKRKFSVLGSKATALKRKTRDRIDVIAEVARFRRASTGDPFEEPQREPTSIVVGNMMASLGSLTSAISEKQLLHYS